MKTNAATIHRRCRSDAPRRSPRVALCAAAAIGLLCVPAAATAANRWVNDNAASYLAPGTSCTRAGYSTIQAAVDAAVPGDVIRICPGKYVENVAVAKNDLAIIGTSGAAATMVRAATSTYVFVISGTGVTLRGLTIIAAGFADGDIGVNVGIAGATGLTVLDNVIFGGRIGINLGCVSAGSVIASNALHGQTEAGINIDTCEAPPFPGSHNNFIHHNVACSVTSTASIALGGASDDNRIQNNVATKISVFGSSNVVRYNSTQVPIVDNGSGSTLNNNLVDAGVCPAAP
jgi:hypothetical protein